MESGQVQFYNFSWGRIESFDLTLLNASPQTQKSGIFKHEPNKQNGTDMEIRLEFIKR